MLTSVSYTRAEVALNRTKLCVSSTGLFMWEDKVAGGKTNQNMHWTNVILINLASSSFQFCDFIFYQVFSSYVFELRRRLVCQH